MKKEKKERSISALYAPVLLLMLAAGILTVLLGGVRIYQQQNARGQASENQRTAALFLTNQIRQAPGPITLEPFGMETALVIREEVAGAHYITRIYCADGWLRQLFTPETGTYFPEDGEKVLPMQSVQMAVEGNLLVLTMTDIHGTCQVLKLQLPIREGENSE